jgi:uncharacterized protein YecE (DUF72 family)
VSERVRPKRFRYLYDEKDLREWAPKIARMAEDAKETQVLMNNCFADYAQRNARELAGLLGV